jgi:hypothetical protein
MDCCNDPVNRVDLPVHEEEDFITSISTLRTTRVRQWKCSVCGSMWWNGVDLDAARHNTDVDGHYGVTYAD